MTYDEFWRRATRWPQRRGQRAWQEPFAYHIVLLARDLAEARPDHNEPVTDPKIEAVGELFEAFDRLRQEWLPYMKPRLVKVDQAEKPT